MSFQNNSLWMRNGDMGYENSPKTEPKRPHNWSMDAHTPDQPDWFCTKKQALESATGHPSSVYQNLSFPLSGSGFFRLSGHSSPSNMDFRALCQDQPDDSLISLSMDPTFNNANGNISFISTSPTLKRGDNDISPLVHDRFFPINEKVVSHETAAPSVVPIGTTSNNWSEGNADPNVNAVVNTLDYESKTNKIRKNNEPKKNLSNSFPTNVKSLLSSGIFDGVPVKYVSWGRDKSLRGIIKGSSYLCDCSDCKLSTAVNAYEFERHAGCKTKHPNNHIHFQNGKTVYAVVQELKNTPQQNLFDAIQTITGSHINNTKFCTWKDSYDAGCNSHT